MKKKCKICGDPTSTIFNIELKPVHVCENCARLIFIQQAVWYSNNCRCADEQQQDKTKQHSSCNQNSH